MENEAGNLPPAEQPSALRNEESNMPKPKRVWWKRVLLWGLVFFGGGFLLLVLLVVIALQDIPPMTSIENPQTALSTQVFSADGQLLRSIYQEKNRIGITLDQISPHVLDALIATEDTRFYDHCGVDPEAMIAIVKDLFRGVKRGGSTITMQLARNLYDQVGRQRSAWRKFKEIIVAVILESKFTKEEIITGYLNTVSFVGNTYGIQNAARTYFKKDAKDLNIEESALLVGLLKAPDQYNPIKHPKAALARRNTVIELMAAQNIITQAESDSIKNIELNLSAYEMEDYNTGLAPYFTEHLRLWLNEWCKTRNIDPYTAGLRVYTTIDSRMQRYAEEATTEHLGAYQKVFDKQMIGREPWRRDSSMLVRAMKQSYRGVVMKGEGKSEEQMQAEFRKPRKMKLFSWTGVRDTTLSPWDSLKYYSRFLETGFISIDPSNGHIKAWVGGIDHTFFKYDHVAKGKRQVGSTFKPFVYCAALDNGFSPCDKELNQPVVFKNEKGEVNWTPHNADGKTGGFMTLRQGLATSTNLITARVMKRIGPDVVCKWAYALGIQTTLDCVPSLALGTTDLSVQELVGAYIPFVNKGVWSEPIFVTRIEDRNGKIIEEFVGKKRQAIKENTAYMMVDMLQAVVNGGTAGRLRFMYKITHPTGGKTGTTQENADGWFVGITPHLVSGAWVGCSDRKMRFWSTAEGQGAAMALPIYALYMKRVYADQDLNFPTSGFQKPRGFNIELDCKKYDRLKGNLDKDPQVDDLDDLHRNADGF